MAQKESYTGLPAILDAYDDFSEQAPFFAVVDSGKRPRFRWIDNNDPSAARAFLEKQFKPMLVAQDQTLFYIRLYEEDPKQDGKANLKDIVAELPVRVVSLDRIEQLPNKSADTMTYEMFETLQALKNIPALIKEAQAPLLEKIELLEAKINEEPEDEPEDDMMGRITGFLDHPSVKQLTNLIIGKVMGGSPQPATNYNRPVNGTSNFTNMAEPTAVDLEVLQNAIDRLAPHCQLDTDLSLLADVAEKNPQMFAMLLNNLRSQK